LCNYLTTYGRRRTCRPITDTSLLIRDRLNSAGQCSILVPRASGESYVISDVMCSGLLLQCSAAACSCVHCEVGVERAVIYRCRCDSLSRVALVDFVSSVTAHAAFSRWQQMRAVDYRRSRRRVSFSQSKPLSQTLSVTVAQDVGPD